MCTLFELLTGLGAELPPSNPEVSGLTLTTTRVRPGDLYVALPGSRAHGADYVAEAARRGAVAVLTDRAGAERAGSHLPVVVVDDPRAVMADVAVRFHRDPGARLALLGITGTNGKTTTTFLVEAALAAAGRTVATIGTIGFRLAGQPIEVDRTTITTPESIELQALLAQFADHNADAVVMEVSSHALALDRVRGLSFAVAGFTNLGRDHLDFHASIDDYFDAKAQLFDPARCAHAVVMTTDQHGQALAERVRAQTPLTQTPLTQTPSTQTPSSQTAATTSPARVRLTTVGTSTTDDVRLQAVVPTATGGTRIVVTGVLGEHDFEIDLPGDYNGRNAALALTMAWAAGVDPEVAIAGLRHAQVPGRMQRIALPEHSAAPPTVLVDFAHTPQAITEAASVGERFARTVIVVGAGGDRDRAKRPLMGAAAATAADLVVVTDDNPRTENPASIRAAVSEGARSVEGGAEVIEIGDRARAIAHALAWATGEDLVLVLGKGHETGQLVGHEHRPFDDADQVVRQWQELSR